MLKFSSKLLIWVLDLVHGYGGSLGGNRNKNNNNNSVANNGQWNQFTKY